MARSRSHGNLSTSGELCEHARQSAVLKLELLLSARCDVNAADYDKRNALHVAASEGALKVVELLVAHGANVNSLDRWGGTPVRDAVKNGHDKLSRYLLDLGGTLGFDEVTASSELCELDPSMAGGSNIHRAFVDLRDG